MTVYLINLDQDQKRRLAAEAQLNRLAVPFQRIPAVYGKALPIEEQTASVNRFRWWCAMGRPIELGELGCALSHKKIYEMMIAQALPVACILEDDVLLADAFPQQLTFVESRIDPTQPQVVLLSNHTKAVGKNGTLQPARTDTCTEGYIITLPAARNLLKYNFPLKTPCDHWGRWVRYRIIQLYHAFPTVCTQDYDSFVSHIDISPLQNALKNSRLRRYTHKFKRLIGLTLDRLLPR